MISEFARVAISTTACFRRILAPSRPTLAVFAAAAVLVTVAEALDRLHHDRFEAVEEMLEVLGAFVVAGGFIVLAMHHLVRLMSIGASDQCLKPDLLAPGQHQLGRRQLTAQQRGDELDVAGARAALHRI